MLSSVLNRLPSPVCLIAHNGDLYDFPLLQEEMDNIGTSLNSQIMCADSYTGIKDIFKKRNEVKKFKMLILKKQNKIKQAKLLRRKLNQLQHK